MSNDAKGQLCKLLNYLGHSRSCAKFKNEPGSSSENHRVSLTVTFPNGHKVYGFGEGRRIVHAEIAAAQDVLNQLHQDYPDLFIDDREIKVRAQAGDTLIKLAVYIASDPKTADQKSLLLQRLESDSHLAKVFDCWKSQGHPHLAMCGKRLGKKQKATLVEALLWKQFEEQVIATDAIVQLQFLLDLIDQE